MNHFKDVNDLYKDIIDKYPKLTTYEALDIATKIQNCYSKDQIAQAIKEGLVVTGQNKPVALEAIAMILGYDNYDNGIIGHIQELVSKK